MLLWVSSDTTWVWVLTELDDGRTRLVTRIRSGYVLPGALLGCPLVELADFPMMRKQLLGIAGRAEATTA